MKVFSTAAALLLLALGIGCLVVCLATEINDPLFLCLALGATGLGNFINLYAHKKLH